MLKRALEVLMHLLFWGATSWLIISTFAVEEKDIQIINNVKTVHIAYNSDITLQLATCIVLCALTVYTSVYTIAKQYQEKAKPFLLSLLYLVLFISLFEVIRKVNIIPASPAVPFTLIAGIYFFYYIAGITYAVTRLWQKTELLRRQMEVEKRETELALLRSQLQPHFLFNVLNSLLSMVERNRNPGMAKAILGLSDLLRYVINESGKGLVPLQKEIQFIKNYAELQQLRFEDNEVRFSLEVKGSLENQYCEHGVFIPFIENAFKYGTEPEKQSEITVIFDVTAMNRIVFTITNALYPALKSFEGNGVGIAAARKRLEMTYPGRYRLKYGPENDLFIVHLELNTDESNYSG